MDNAEVPQAGFDIKRAEPPKHPGVPSPSAEITPPQPNPHALLVQTAPDAGKSKENQSLSARFIPTIERAFVAAKRLGDDYRRHLETSRDPRTILQRNARRRDIFGWHPKGLLWLALGKTATRGIVIGSIGLAATTTGVAGFLDRTNPDTSDLASRDLQVQTSLIVDRDGNLQQQIVAPASGRRNEVGLSEISPNLINATVATEDKFFWGNWVKDTAYGVARSVMQNLKESWQAKRLKVVSGGSTITQQVARNLFDLHYLFDQSQELDGTAGEFVRKAREIVLAAEINRNFSKTEILELYLNNNYYGYGAYGVEAASQTYFGKSAKDLTLMEGAFLAGGTQGPEVYDPYTNREVVNDRVKQVLEYVKKNYGTESCTGVTGKACYPYKEIENAVKEIENYQFKTPPQGYDHAAWVDMVEGQLHGLYPGDAFYNAGVNVKTTIDSSLQKGLDEALSQTSVTDSIVIWDHSGAIQAIGGDVFPADIKIRTSDGEFSLLELAESFELSRGNKLNLHAIGKITKIRDGKLVVENPPLINAGGNSAIMVDKTSLGEEITLPDGTSAVFGYSENTDGFRYNWIIGEKDGRNFIYWTSDKDPQTALLAFQDIVNRINSIQKPTGITETPVVPLTASLYVEKLPDGTIHFSDRVDLIKDKELVGPYITPKMIIIHWSGNTDPDKSHWLSTTNRNGLVGGGNSATFAVGVDGVLQLVEMNETQVQATTASTGRNNVAINIEMDGSWFDKNPPPEAEIEYTVDLMAKLLLKYHLDIDQVRGHYEEDTTIIIDPGPPVVYRAADPSDPKAYDWGKPDPGEKFMQLLKGRIEKRIEELQGKTGSTASFVKTRAAKQFPPQEIASFLPPHIEIRRNEKTGWYDYYDNERGKFVTGKELEEAIRLENSIWHPVVSEDLGGERKANQEKLIAMQNSPRARQQARASGNARLREAQRQARVNFPRGRGRA